MAVEYRSIGKRAQVEKKVDVAMLAKAYKKLNEVQSETVSEEYVAALSRPRSSTYLMNLGKLLMLSSDGDEIEKELRQLEREEQMEREEQAERETPQLLQPEHLKEAELQLQQESRQAPKLQPQLQPEQELQPEPWQASKQEPELHQELQLRPQPQQKQESQQEMKKKARRQHKLDLEAKLAEIRSEMQECMENMKREIPKVEKTEESQGAQEAEQEKAQVQEPVGFLWPSDLTDMLLEKGYLKDRGVPVTNVSEQKGAIEQAQGEKMAQAFEKAYELFDIQLTYESNNPFAKRMWMMEYHPDIICGIYSDGSTKTYVRGKDWN